MRNRFTGAALAVAALLFAAQVNAADNYAVKDASGTTITMKAKEVAGVKAVTHTVAASDGTTLINPATSDKQPSLGTAGTPSSNVLTVQGITSMTALKIDGSAVTQPVSGTFWQTTQPVSAASLPLPTGAATAANQSTANGYLSTLAGAVSTGNVNVICTSGCSGGGGSGYSVLNASTYGNTSSYSNVPSGGLVTTAAPTFTNNQASPLSLTTAGALRVDGSAVTQPVSGSLTNISGTISLPTGAATAALQTTLNGYVDGIETLIGTTNSSLSTLTGAVSAGNVNVVCTSGCSGGGGSGYSVLNASTYANSSSYSNVPAGGFVTTAAPTFTNNQASPLSLTTAGALRVDGSAVTQPISAASLPLPTGAATAAKQPALGTAGTASTDVITTQGIVGGVPQPVATTIANPTSVLTRPANATAYAAADLIASSTTAGSIVVPSVTAARVSGGSVTLGRVKLNTSATSGMGGVNIQVDLWTAAPTFTNGDNGVYAVATGAAGYLGTATVTLQQFADGAVGTALVADGPINVKLASGQAIYWTAQTLSVFTPTSGQTFTLTAEAVQN